MNLNILKPSKSLNKAYYKESVKRSDIESLKAGLKLLYNRIDEKESEEHLKNIIADFLKTAIYQNKYEINTRHRIDLAIHNGKTSKDTVGVIIETKKPQSPERITIEDFNSKALHELILYYFEERNELSNIEVKHLVTTNIYEWFIFDENEFDKLFYRNAKLQKLYKSKIEQGKDKPFFYAEAQKIVADIEDEITCTYFNLNNYKKAALNTDFKDDDQLIDLYKILSPEHLLKLPFTNDSNSLNKEFYTELLHIIGLEEIKEGSKKLINRKKPENRDDGSLLENTINILRSEGCLANITNPEQYGETEEARLFSISLELCINWLNRILFLKLLEGQLITYHKGNTEYTFLNSSNIKDLDELNELFFEVLAVKTNERTKSVSQKFDKIPYLNSSLFERSELENHTIRINSLKDRLELPVYKSTVIKDNEGTRISGKKPALHYLFDFLDAYDFASESGAKIQEQNKSIINASVLGLIFEKINGYKDGSFFTPGFITMYMCHETIRRAVIQKFNERYAWDNKGFNDLKDKLDCTNKAIRQEANKLINSLKICDPAVGSGHFLVSALNELIAIKCELGILQFREEPRNRIRGYKITIENDELIIIDEETDEIFEYTLNQNKRPITELQALQETIFHEKQAIIENCLFGVDINPKSVMICRLRLWIELLKNSYYTKESNYTELETLPNIDINIKCGNSLISRFPLDADLSKALKSIKYDIKAYQGFVNDYKNAQDKQLKRSLEQIINSIKTDFRSEIYNNDPKVIRLNKLGGELYSLLHQQQMFEPSAKEKTARKQQQEKLETEINKLSAEIEVIKSSSIYRNAFEWRFEFPEVLDDEGNFVGFDVVIGNPPYGVRLEQTVKHHLHNLFPIVPDFEIYLYFITKSLELINKGYLCFIQPNTFMAIVNGKKIRQFIIEKSNIAEIVDLSTNNIFEDANVRTCILTISNKKEDVVLKQFNDKAFYINQIVTPDFLLMNKDNWLTLFSVDELKSPIIQKIRKNRPLSDYCNIIRGYIAYRRSDLIKLYGNVEGNLIIDQKLWHSDIKKDESFYPEIMGRDLFKYYYSKRNLFVKYGKHLASYVDFKFYHNPHIAVREIAEKSLICSFIDAEIISSSSTHLIVAKDSCLLDLKVFLSLLNSKLIGWYHYNTSPKAKKGMFPKVLVNDLNTIPIPTLTEDFISSSISLANSILKLKKKNIENDTTALESEIDQLVFQLYGLTEEEIKIVEGKKL